MSQSLSAKQVFQSLDKDGNGKIDREEYTQALLKMHIPQVFSEIVTESVFSKFDTNQDAGIDQDEFVKYFSESTNADVHRRLFRSVFQERFLMIWGVYFLLIGIKITTDPAGLVGDAFPGSLEDGSNMGPARHMAAVLGCSFLSGGVNAILQSGMVGSSSVFSYGCLALFWAALTMYENVVGSIVGQEGFQRPPWYVTLPSLLMGLYGIWGIRTDRAKVKEE
jgi:hypothetical protein